MSYSVVRYSAKALPDNYRGLVYSFWLKSLRHGNDYFKLITPAAYFDAYSKFITRILEQPRAAVRLACLTDEPDVVLGFSVSRGSVLDYVYVRKDVRRLGVGTSLVPGDIDTTTHLTRTGLTIWGSKTKWAFNPFA